MFWNTYFKILIIYGLSFMPVTNLAFLMFCNYCNRWRGRGGGGDLRLKTKFHSVCFLS